jgi:hypothetical protein
MRACTCVHRLVLRRSLLSLKSANSPIMCYTQEFGDSRCNLYLFAIYSPEAGQLNRDWVGRSPCQSIQQTGTKHMLCSVLARAITIPHGTQRTGRCAQPLYICADFQYCSTALQGFLQSARLQASVLSALLIMRTSQPNDIQHN